MNRQRLVNTILIIKWRLRDKFRRYCEAIAYARNRMNRSQANDIIYNCQTSAGWYPLETLSVDGCLQTALDCYWQDHPELESLVKSACARVAGKWESSGDPEIAVPELVVTAKATASGPLSVAIRRIAAAVSSSASSHEIRCHPGSASPFGRVRRSG
jgi:hypothetical protein